MNSYFPATSLAENLWAANLMIICDRLQVHNIF